MQVLPKVKVGRRKGNIAIVRKHAGFTKDKSRKAERENCHRERRHAGFPVRVKGEG